MAIPPSGGGGVLQDSGCCGVLSAGNEGKLVFLDLRSAARGELAGLQRRAAARSPAEGGLAAARGAGMPKPTTPKPTTTLAVVDGDDGDEGDAPPPAEATSPELPPQGVLGWVGVMLRESSMPEIRRGLPWKARAFRFVFFVEIRGN